MTDVSFFCFISCIRGNGFNASINGLRLRYFREIFNQSRLGSAVGIVWCRAPFQNYVIYISLSRISVNKEAVQFFGADANYVSSLPLVVKGPCMLMSSYWIHCDRCWWQRPPSRTHSLRAAELQSFRARWQTFTGTWSCCFRPLLSAQGGRKVPPRLWTTVKKRSADNRPSHKTAGATERTERGAAPPFPIRASESRCRTDQSLPQIAIDRKSLPLIDQFHLQCVCVLIG